MSRFFQRRGSAEEAGRRARAGFTLLEVMLVLALMAAAGSLFVVSVESLGRSSPADAFEGAFWRALAQGREHALATRRTVELRWDGESRAFVVAAADGERVFAVLGESGADDEKYDAAFSEEVASNDFILVRGELVTRRAVASVRLFPDGTCQPFTAHFVIGTYRNQVTIDPWTGAAMLSGAETGTGGGS